VAIGDDYNMMPLFNVTCMNRHGKQ